ncbi:MAG: ATP-grasp domain-containing protein [Thermoleophilia bacterium]|nr:ATP-grasp domain-containing protein [Thermoleophilia bacterium]
MPPSDLDTSAPSTETPEMPAGFPDGSTPEARRPHRATPPRVMLLWAGWRPGPWTGAALEGSGWHVTAAHPSDGGHAWSGSEGGLVRYPDPAHDEDAFVEWLAQACHQRRIDVVIPLEERIVEILARRGDRLRPALVAGPDAGQYRALCDKGVLPETCDVAGVPHPPTCVVTDRSGSAALPPLPNVVKPARELEVGEDVPAARVVTTDAARAEAIERILAHGVPAVVQRELAGQQWGVYCAVDGRGVHGVAARVETTAPRVAGTPSRLQVRRTPDAVLAVARRLLEAVDYRGMANLDVIEVDGVVHVLDVNLRPAASAGLAVHAGVDLASIAIGDLIGRSPATPELRRGFRYVSLEGELRVLRELRGVRSRLALAVRLLRDVFDRGTLLDPSPTDRRWLRGMVARRFGR